MRFLLVSILVTGLISVSTATEADSSWQQLQALHQRLEAPTPAGVNSVEFRAGPKKTLYDAAASFAQQFPADSRTPNALVWKIETTDFGGNAEDRLQLLEQNEKDAQTIAGNSSAAPELRSEAEQAALENWIDNSDVLTSPRQLAALEQRVAAFLANHPSAAETVPYQLARADLLFRFDSKKATEFLEQLSRSSDPKLAAAALARLDRAQLIGKPLQLSFSSLDGSNLDLDKLRGKVVLINFWATWCPDCIRELPIIKEVWQKHRDNFVVVGISLDRDRQSLENFIARKSLPWPQYFDGEGWNTAIATRYAVHSIPESWLIDKEGIVRATAVQAQDLETQVARLIAE
jgi:thiol-disulfide isomerase/thioredoxin